MNTSWLIAIDGSMPSLKAIDYLIAEANSRQATPQVFLINVQPPLSSDITRFVDHKLVEEHHREAGDTALAEARQKLDAAGLSYSAHILIGEAAPTIVKFASEKACSLIIMGAHGFGRLVGLFMGSVTVKVVQLSPLPVLLIK